MERKLKLNPRSRNSNDPRRQPLVLSPPPPPPPWTAKRKAPRLAPDPSDGSEYRPHLLGPPLPDRPVHATSAPHFLPHNVSEERQRQSHSTSSDSEKPTGRVASELSLHNAEFAHVHQPMTLSEEVLLRWDEVTSHSAYSRTAHINTAPQPDDGNYDQQLISSESFPETQQSPTSILTNMSEDLSDGSLTPAAPTATAASTNENNHYPFSNYIQNSFKPTTNHNSNNNNSFIATLPSSSSSEVEWTPQDSAYGAACPFCGFVPKPIRRAIETTLILLLLFSLILSIVALSIRLTNQHVDSPYTPSQLTDDDYYVQHGYDDDDSSKYYDDDNDDLYNFTGYYKNATYSNDDQN